MRLLPGGRGGSQRGRPLPDSAFGDGMAIALIPEDDKPDPFGRRGQCREGSGSQAAAMRRAAVFLS